MTVAGAKPISEREVAAYFGARSSYPENAPFHPSSRYPEALFEETGSEENGAYDAVRECLAASGLDSARSGTADWNPLGELIRPGEVVLLKPNLVKERHPREARGWQWMLTHGAIVRAAADYVFTAVGRSGRVVVADAPQTDSSFSAIRELIGLDRIAAFYSESGYQFEVVDLRKEEWSIRDEVVVSRRSLSGDPRGYVAFDLGRASEFLGHAGAGHYYGADYDAGEVNRHHSGGRHEYLLSGTAIKADVVISLPKLKTHKKAGVTVALKNLVGINGDKNWLPHHSESGGGFAGDEHPAPDSKHRIERVLAGGVRQLSTRLPVIGTWIHRKSRSVGKKLFGDTEEVIRSGNWWGNDTIWRMCLDLNKLLAYGEPDGRLRQPGADNRKRHLVIVDGIVAGEGRGPMNPDPVRCGVVLFGLNAPSVDAAAAYLMGFNPDRIPIVRQAFKCSSYPLAEWDWRDVLVRSNRHEFVGRLGNIPDRATFHFRPHFGWKRAIERRTIAGRVEGTSSV